MVRGKFKNLIAEKYGNHKITFTNGSKNEGVVGSAAVMDANRETVSLPCVTLPRVTHGYLFEYEDGFTHQP